MVAHGSAFSAPHGEILRMGGTIFFNRNSIVIGVTAIAFESSAAVGVVGVAVEHLTAAGGENQLGRTHFTQTDGNFNFGKLRIVDSVFPGIKEAGVEIFFSKLHTAVD